MQSYLELLSQVLKNGHDQDTRNGMVRKAFGLVFRHNLQDGFPLITTRKIDFKVVAAELIWFLEGSTDDNRLKEILGYDKTRRTIWTANTEAPWWIHKRAHPGDLGRIYGAQWRCWSNKHGEQIDQISRLISGLIANPSSRDHVVTAWNPSDLNCLALNPCHMIFQCVEVNGMINLHMMQRAADLFLGLPYNIASYSALLTVISKLAKRKAGTIMISISDAHIYHPHIPSVNALLQRSPKQLPRLTVSEKLSNLIELKLTDLVLEGYNPHSALRAPFIL